MGVKYFLFILLLNVGLSFSCSAQQDSAFLQSPYRVHFKYEVPAAILSLGVTQYLYTKLPSAAVLTPNEALALDKNTVNSFDRPVLNFPASGYKKAHNNSNYVMYSTFAMPALLLLDKNVRRDWKEFATMYVETHALSSALYLGPSFTVRRARPLAYNTDYPIELRSGESTYNAFFSGHVNSTAATSFFMAQVYSQYRDLNIGQKVLLYLGASVPPALVTHYRMRAGKHFRTDVLTGFAFGAATGLLVPELHKRRKNAKLSYIPIINENMVGMNLRYTF